MRLFQFITVYAPYVGYFERKFPEAAKASFKSRRSLLLSQRYYASHILKPVFDCDPNAFFTVTNDAVLQGRWAQENGLKSREPAEILRAQIEHHRTEVLYSLDPLIYDTEFVKSLPGCVKKTLCWNAAPRGRSDLSGYGMRLANFPPMLDFWRKQGLRAEHFFPAHDPTMDQFSENRERPIDLAFVGQYWGWWKEKRNAGLQALSTLAEKYLLSFRLLAPKWKPLMEVRGIQRIKLPVPYLPKELREVSYPPVYGLEMYEVLSMSKVVFNASPDLKILPIGGEYRGNMRCFEALGCGACMISDEGIYSDGFRDGEHFISYKDAEDAVRKACSILESQDQGRAVALAGRSFVRETFSKAKQWERFRELVDLI
jgi:hypothetical protein